MFQKKDSKEIFFFFSIFLILFCLTYEPNKSHQVRCVPKIHLHRLTKSQSRDTVERFVRFRVPISSYLSIYLSFDLSIYLSINPSISSGLRIFYARGYFAISLAAPPTVDQLERVLQSYRIELRLGWDNRIGCRATPFTCIDYYCIQSTNRETQTNVQPCVCVYVCVCYKSHVTHTHTHPHIHTHVYISLKWNTRIKGRNV